MRVALIALMLAVLPLNAQQERFDREAEEAAVYLVVLQASREKGAAITVHAGRRGAPGHSVHLLRAFGADFKTKPGLIEDFDSINLTSTVIKTIPVGTIPIAIVPDSVSRQIREQSGTMTTPDAFYTVLRQRYPNTAGMHGFTRVGFSAYRQQAVVHAFFGCGSLCGRGYFVLLEKVDGRWRIVREVTTVHI